MEIDENGECYLCCPGWLPRSVGNVRKVSPQAVWSSSAAREIRESILDGSFRYCAATRCPYLVQGSLPTVDSVDVESYRQPEWDQRPRTLNLCYDRTCNLSCPSCRRGLWAAGAEAQTKAIDIQKKVLQWGLRDARTLMISGSGDPLASKVFRELLENWPAHRYPSLGLILQTNGLLLTPAMWEKMAGARKALRRIKVSIDGATPETYRKLRRGGELSRLIPNLEFLAERRRLGELAAWTFVFVVQTENFHEMPTFVEFARRYGADAVHFLRIDDWRVLSRAEYRDAAIHQPSHRRHGELLKVLQHPLLGSPEVDLLNLAALRSNGAELRSRSRPPKIWRWLSHFSSAFGANR